MARIMAFDYGTKRVGVAVTDRLQLIATGLTTIHPADAVKYISDFMKTEEVECIVIGEPKRLNGLDTDSTKPLQVFINTLKNNFPQVKFERMDERFTSKIAFDAMISGGLKKSQRRNKELVDEMSATIILQDYLKTIQKEN